MQKNLCRNLLGLLFALFTLSGCLSAKYYIDPALKDVNASALRKPASPQAAQLAFEFQTNGKTNPRATDALKQKITDTTKQSGLFSNVSTDPLANSALLTIVINNIADLKEAQSKGFKTGLTLGASGTMVTDAYLCTMNYSRPGAAEIHTTVNHALHTTIGNQEGPAGLTPQENAMDAINKIMEQMVLNGLKQISDDPNFK
ncbi:MAG: hypothetical protein EPO06_05775 [Burkholderiaceae bacterium]|nr:MAG: hypothetical protein EPO06_05775 [Burkholderiaceae bacterium]